MLPYSNYGEYSEQVIVSMATVILIRLHINFTVHAKVQSGLVFIR